MRRSWSFCVSIGSQKTGKEALKEQKYLRHAQSKAFFLHLMVEYNLALIEYSGMTQSWVRDNALYTEPSYREFAHGNHFRYLHLTGKSLIPEYIPTNKKCFACRLNDYPSLFKTFKKK